MTRTQKTMVGRSLFWVLMLCLVAPAQQVSAATLETRIKAAFLYKFCSYVEWPTGTFSAPDSPIVIGVVADKDVVRELNQAIKGQHVHKRQLDVRAYDTTAVPSGVHLLFIGRSALSSAPRWLDRMQGKGVMLVTDIPNGLDSGSGINFDLEGDRLRFDVSLAATTAQGLRVSSQLLSVARRVRNPSK
jgi:hypothetical protein